MKNEDYRDSRVCRQERNSNFSHNCNSMSTAQKVFLFINDDVLQIAKRIIGPSMSYPCMHFNLYACNRCRPLKCKCIQSYFNRAKDWSYQRMKYIHVCNRCHPPTLAVLKNDATKSDSRPYTVNGGVKCVNLENDFLCQQRSLTSSLVAPIVSSEKIYRRFTRITRGACVVTWLSRTK